MRLEIFGFQWGPGMLGMGDLRLSQLGTGAGGKMKGQSDAGSEKEDIPLRRASPWILEDEGSGAGLRREPNKG